MSLLSSELLERARALGERGPLPPWPGVLAQVDVEPLDDRLEAAVSWMRGAREAVAASWNQSPGQGLVGLGRLWALATAASAGWELSMVGGRTLIVRRGSERATLLPVSVPAPRPRDQRLLSLQQRLQGLFEDRSWALIVRRPLPEDMDVDRIIEPVRMWLVALDRGRWDGDYAIYEDGGVSLELRVLNTDRDVGGRTGLVMRLADAAGDLLIKDIGERLAAAIEGAEAPDNLPLIPVLVRGAPWRMPRRRRFDLLYGKLEESTSIGNAGASVTFRHSDKSFFAGEQAERVAAVWWLGSDTLDPLTPRGWADENPWGRFSGAGPRFPGHRLAVVATGPEEDGQPASLSWLSGSLIPR